MPSWPSTPPEHGAVVLRAFTDDDVPLAVELGADPYVKLIGTLVARPTAEQALEWVRRQQGRLAEGRGLSFVIADRGSGEAVGTIGLWLRELSQGRATAGFSVAPQHRGRGRATSAVRALLGFAWTVPGLHRVELYIEPWNTSSLRVAEAAGFEQEGFLHSHQEIGGRRRDMWLFAATRD
jgi:ribosomal-protein-alanine N-acetyltransferase